MHRKNFSTNPNDNVGVPTARAKHCSPSYDMLIAAMMKEDLATWIGVAKAANIKTE